MEVKLQVASIEKLMEETIKALHSQIDALNQDIVNAYVFEKTEFFIARSFSYSFTSN